MKPYNEIRCLHGGKQMDRNIFYDFQNNRNYTIELLDGIASAVSLFVVSDEIRFLHFNRAADALFGYEKGALFSLTQKDALCIFHPDYVDRLYGEIIATMREDRLFNYDCRILCKDGSYQWTNLSAQLVQQKEGALYFHCVLTPIPAPRRTLLKGQHFLIAAGEYGDRRILSELIEKMGGTCDITDNGMDALDLFTASEEWNYNRIFIGSRMGAINGFELAKDIRYCGRSDGDEIPLVLLVSPDDEETIQAVQDIGIDATLEKPLDPEKTARFLKTLSHTAD